VPNNFLLARGISLSASGGCDRERKVLVCKYLNAV
jgi:hypothetical protein